jgi:uridine kinase
MATWAPAKKDTLEALATEILHSYGVGRTIIAIDGASGPATAVFADELAAALRGVGRNVFRASIDDFQRSHPAHSSPDDRAASHYSDGYDYSLLTRVLIDPFKAAGSTGFVLAGWDSVRQAPIQPKWMSAQADAILIIDGAFLNRPELAGLWNYSVWLDTPPADGADETAADRLYAAEVRPRTAATAIIDNRDTEHPRRVFADSC